MKTKALLLSFLTLAFCAGAQLVPLTIEESAQIADSLSPTYISDRSVDSNRCIIEVRTNRTARVISGQLVFGQSVESLKVLCPTDIAPDRSVFKFNPRFPRHYQWQTSKDGFRSFRTNMIVTPQPPPPPKPDFTGMSMEEIMAAMRAWNLASLQSGRSYTPNPAKSDVFFLGPGNRFVDITP